MAVAFKSIVCATASHKLCSFPKEAKSQFLSDLSLQLQTFAMLPLLILNVSVVPLTEFASRVLQTTHRFSTVPPTSHL